MAKVQISIDDDLLEKVDICADEMYMSRSGFISYSVAQVVNSNLLVKAMKDLSYSVRKIADTGNVDEETKLQLEDFERICKLFSGAGK